MLDLNRQDLPPTGGPEMLVYRLKAGQSIDAIIISKALWGVYTHWNGRTSEPCYQAKGKCPGHKRGLPVRWKGYLHVWDVKKKRQCFLELTPTSAQDLLDALGVGQMRGQRIVIARQNGDKARLTVNVFGEDRYQCDLTKLPDPRDPYRTLAKLWGVDDAALEVFPKDGLPEVAAS